MNIQKVNRPYKRSYTLASTQNEAVKRYIRHAVKMKIKMTGIRVNYEDYG